MNKNQAAWVWAYREQLKFLDEFDARGLQCAERGWSDPAWNGFLNVYSLGRGYHSKLRGSREAILNAVEPLFKKRLPRQDVTGALSKRWEEGVRIVRALPTLKTEDGQPPELWSFASKLLWFYHPDEMTMYDNNAKKGLHSIAGCPVTHRNFLQIFEEQFARQLPDINLAGTRCDRKYPYQRRVLDKWLWLKGNKDGEARLHNFQLSLKLAPITPFPVISDGY